MYINAMQGPLVMELDTYRYYGHSMSDPGKRYHAHSVCEGWYCACIMFYFSYRPPEEVKAVREEKDPIKIVEDYATEGNLATSEELKVFISVSTYTINFMCSTSYIQELRKSARAEVDEAVKYSLEGTDLPPQELYTDVYTDQAEKGLFIRGSDPFTNNKSY